MGTGQFTGDGLGRISSARLAQLLDLDPQTRCSSARIAAGIRQLVGDGRLGVSVRLPAERGLADSLGVSRAMITAAYGLLRRDGWAAARQGAGTWITLPDGGAFDGSRSVGLWAPDAGQPDLLDLAHAAPSAPPQVAPAFVAALAALPRALPSHGYYPSGLPELRARIADRYTARGLPTLPEQVLVTGGALHALTLVLAVLARRGAPVLIEHPTYPNALSAIRARGARLVEAAVEPGEAFATATRDALRSAKPALAYLMPDVHNPTGRSLDPVELGALAAAFAAAKTVPIVDETLADLQLDGPAGLSAAAAWPNAICLGSLSKSVWGGLRIGWIRARSELVRALTAAAAGALLAGPVVEQLAACRLLDILEEVLDHRRAELRERRGFLQAALAARLPAWGVPSPAAGLALWCRLPPPHRSSALALAAEGRGLRLAPGSLFGTGRAFEDRLRLPYTLPVHRLDEAVDILAGLDGESLAVQRGSRREPAAIL